MMMAFPAPGAPLVPFLLGLAPLEYDLPDGADAPEPDHDEMEGE